MPRTKGVRTPRAQKEQRLIELLTKYRWGMTVEQINEALKNTERYTYMLLGDMITTGRIRKVEHATRNVVIYRLPEAV